jgi:hypothetical protein
VVEITPAEEEMKIVALNRNKIINHAALFTIFCALLPALSIAAPIKIQPLGEAEVKSVIAKLNEQGIILGYERIKKNEVFGYNNEHGSFGIADTGEGWYLYKADINNDKEDEYILLMFGGSGAFLDIEAIYKDDVGKFTDIFDQIKLPMRRLIRETEQATYDLEDGYTGFMNGGIDIESDDGKMYFTMHQTTRDYGIDDYEKSFQPPQYWKFLWDQGGIKLIDAKVNKRIEQ